MVGPSPALIQANAKDPLLGPGLGPLYIKKQTNKNQQHLRLYQMKSVSANQITGYLVLRY